jgi:hypothetical protein
MKHDTLPVPSTLAFTFNLGPGIWAELSPDNRIDVLRHHMKRAWRVLADTHLPLPNPDPVHRLELVVMAAAEAEALFFSAAIVEPTSEDLDEFFADFICRALMPFQSVQ